MPAASNWRDPAYAEQFAHFDYADFAQEFLRRNPEYRQDYADVQNSNQSDRKDARQTMEVLARRWGLSFPMLPECVRQHGAGALGARPDSFGGHPR